MQLYRRYRREEVLAFFRDRGAAERRCGGQWVIYPDAALCFAVVGDLPNSTFNTAVRFRWRTERADGGSKDARFPFLPDEVRANSRPHRPIWLFLKRPEWDDYAHVGQLEPAYSWGGKVGSWHADFDLESVLPGALWAEFHGPEFRVPDPARLDAAFKRLGQTADADTRFAVLQEFVEYWHGPIGADDGLTEGECALVPMPTMLKRWYRWVGRRSDIVSGQNFLLRPEPERAGAIQPYRLRMSDGRLFFYTENQGCYLWGTLPDGDDPPVFGRLSEADPWKPEGVTLGEHLILACLFEAILCHAPYAANSTGLDRKRVDEIAAVIPPIAIGPWRWLNGGRFHAGGGAFMVVMGADGEGDSVDSVWIGAKTQAPLAFLHSLADIIDWDSAAF